MNRNRGNPARITRRPVAGVILALALAGLACGTTLVTIRVDVMSFLTDEELIIGYGDSPVIPGNGPEITVRSVVETVPLPDDIQTITQIQALEIRSVLDFRNETGSPTIVYRIYFDESPATIFDSPPVIEQTVDLQPGSRLRHEILIEGDDRLLRLFQASEISVASEIEISPGGGPDNIVGEVEIVELSVQVSAAGED